LDPFVALAFAAAATTRLRLHTNLCIPAYRNPFLLAKSVASLDALSGGRVILGIGAGYLRSEFDALGMPFDQRNDATDEAIKAMRAAWTGDSVAMDGTRFHARGNTMLPTPAQAGGPPIWIGGNSRTAVRRAVQLADGWSPFPNPAKSAERRRTPALETIDDLRRFIALARDEAEAAGRTAPLEIVFMPLGLECSPPHESTRVRSSRASSSSLRPASPTHAPRYPVTRARRCLRTSRCSEATSFRRWPRSEAFGVALPPERRQEPELE
jgi:probable F420-dependent oxidoreductase